MTTDKPGYQKAVDERRRHMQAAREAMFKARNTGDPIYWDIARVHVKTARAFNRTAWKGSR